MSNSGNPKTVERDDRTWQLGDGNTVSWINRNTRGGLAITSAIPPRFERYATIAEMEDFTSPEDLVASQERVVRVLRQHGSMKWWLGFLDTGGDDIVFPGTRKIKLYANWPYVIVKAGPDQALRCARRCQTSCFRLTGPGVCRPCGTTAGLAWAVRAFSSISWNRTPTSN